MILNTRVLHLSFALGEYDESLTWTQTHTNLTHKDTSILSLSLFLKLGYQFKSTSTFWRWTWGDWAGGCEPWELYKTPSPKQVGQFELLQIVINCCHYRLCTIVLYLQINNFLSLDLKKMAICKILYISNEILKCRTNMSK